MIKSNACTDCSVHGSRPDTADIIENKLGKMLENTAAVSGVYLILILNSSLFLLSFGDL